MKRSLFLFSLAVASAVLVAASFPPYNLAFLAWFSLSPFLFALRQGSDRAAGAAAFAFGACFSACAFNWFQSVEPVGPGNILFFLMVFGMYSCLFGFFYRLVALRGGFWTVLSAPALWVAVEYFRSNVSFLSWPWNLLGHSQYKFLPVVQMADLTGVYGISFVMVMVNQALSEIPGLWSVKPLSTVFWKGEGRPMGSWPMPFAVVALVLLSVFLYGWYRLGERGVDRHIRVALVQANVVAREGMSFADQREHLLAYERLTREAARSAPDLIVWPSSSLPAPMNVSRMVRLSVTRLAEEVGCHLLVGGAGYAKMKPRKERYLPYSNSEFLISPSGRIEGQYNKIQLLPFNETVPLGDSVAWPEWITTTKESFLAGDTYTLFHVSGARFGTPICWENMFPDFFRRFVKDGANLMVSVSNEAFMGRTGGAHQTLAINCFRAVENRVAVVRITTTGVSAFIDANGRILEKVTDEQGNDLFVPGYVVRDVPLRDRKTLYTLHGDVFALGAYAISGLAILGALLRRSRTATAQESTHES